MAVLEDEEATRALPVIDIRTPAGSWYDYAHRYMPGLSEHIIPAPFAPEVYRRCEEVALLAHAALGCRDLSRVDMIVREGVGPIVLELNTLPGMTPTSLYPDAAQAAGISLPDLVARLVRRAWLRSAKAP